MHSDRSELSIQQQFIGTWSLKAFEFRRSDGTVVDVLGQDARGLLMYDASGHMSGQMMRVDRPPFASGDQHNGTYDELQAAVAGYIAYFGDYEVVEAEKTIIHHTKAALFPNLVGQDQKRFYEFSGNQMTFTTPPMLVGGVSVVGVVIWEKSL